MLTWRKRGNLLYRYVQKTNKDKDKINSSKEKKTSIAMSIERLDGGITESHGKPVGSILIFNIAVARLTMADDLDLMAVHIIW